MPYFKTNLASKCRFSRLLFPQMTLALLLIGILSGCVASRSQMEGSFDRPGEKNFGADKVSVFFHFRHLTQQHGFDTIPKLQYGGVKDFNNLFRDALVEINNISQFETFTESPADVDSPKRRQELETLRKQNDFTVNIDFFEESSFKQQCFSGTISLLSLTVVPMPYTWNYTITANISDKNGKLVRSYQRKAKLDQWVQALLIFAYPFYPIEGKREEIYSEALHDILRQIETEKIFKM